MSGSSEGRAKGGERLVLNLLLLGVSIGVVLVLFELGLRLFADVPHPFRVDGKDSGEYVFDPLRQRVLNKYVPYRYAPSTRVVRPDPAIMPGLSPEVTFTVDRWGFRGTHEVAFEKPPGTTRIVAIASRSPERRELASRARRAL